MICEFVEIVLIFGWLQNRRLTRLDAVELYAVLLELLNPYTGLEVAVLGSESRSETITPNLIKC